MATGELHLKRLDQKVSVYQTLSREWRPNLTPREYFIMSWLVDFICGWGRVTDTMTHRQMQEGDYRQGTWMPGLGDTIKSSQMREVLTALHQKGFIYKRRRSSCVEITINLDWPKVQGEENVVHLKTPKSKTSGRKIATQTDEAGESECRKPGNQSAGNPADRVPEIRQLSKQYQNNTQSSRPSAGYRQRSRVQPAAGTSEPEASLEPASENATGAGETARAAVKSATERAERRADEKAKLAKTKSNPGAYETTWKRAMAEHFPSVEIAPQWTKAEYGHVKALVRLLPEEDAARKLHEAIEFCIENWRTILRTRLSWMKAAPATPSIKFFVQQREVFMSAYAEHRTQAWIDGLPEERRKLERLRSQGKTEEEALVQIAQERAERKMREENDKAVKQARDYYGMARLAAKNAPVRYDATNPHPRAHENKRPEVRLVEKTPEQIQADLDWMDEVAKRPNPFDEEYE